MGAIIFIGVIIVIAFVIYVIRLFAALNADHPTARQDRLLDRVDKRLEARGLYSQPGGRWSFDWCAYRSNSHCYVTGYDGGTCPRVTWNSQRACSMAQPGPNA
jgi:hypothetical protein